MPEKRLVIISGVSGSGKSTALNAFEDLGFSCIDNLPAPLIEDFVKKILMEEDSAIPPASESEGSPTPANLRLQARPDRDYALLLDCRTPGSFTQLGAVVSMLRERGVRVRMLYLDAIDDVLLRRFKETRRPHPLVKTNKKIATVRDAFDYERELLADFRAQADKIIDSSSFTPHELRKVVMDFYRRNEGEKNSIELTLTSFGFKYGMPANADLVIDVRFMANPHFVPELREHTGMDERVARYVFQTPEAQEFIERFCSLLHFLLPLYLEEGKCYLTVAIGCTGGKHRSVAVVNRLADMLSSEQVQVVVRHIHAHNQS